MVRADLRNAFHRHKLPGRVANSRNLLLLTACAAALIALGGNIRGADPAPPNPAPTFKQYCYQCHGKTAMGGIALERMTAQASISESFEQWKKVASALESKHMPPPQMPQPTDEQRAQAIAWIRHQIDAFAKAHDGDPGRVTVRRLTSGEYAYTIQDLTGLDLNIEHDLVNDEVGGEGFTNFGDVQFLQDAGIERYLEVAKKVADHAVIGAGPLSFYIDPGKTGFELSAVNRIRDIYSEYGFRTVSGEGGRPYGLDLYGKALYSAWRYQHRAALGQPDATLAEIAAREGVTEPFAKHIWSVLHDTGLSYPSSEVVARWKKLPAPGDATADPAKVRSACADIQKFLVTWPSWLFARGDVAAGGAGDERPLEFSDRSLKVEPRHAFRFFRGFRRRGEPMQTGGAATIYLNAELANPSPEAKPVLIWRNATVQFRPTGRRGGPPPAPTPTATPTTDGSKPADPAASTAAVAAAVNPRFAAPDLPRLPLNTVVTSESAEKLAFGRSIDGTPLGPNDFASNGSISFDVKVPDGISVFELQVEAEIGSQRDQVFRITISDRADGGTRGVPVWGLVGDPDSEGYRKWKAAVLQFARILPPNSHGEPTPADKDPIPEPFDNTYNVPEHDEFVVRVKYIRDDQFVVDHIIDAATRKRLDEAWNDLYASFEYHDAYLRLLAKKFNVDLKDKGIAQMDHAALQALPPEMRKYTAPLVDHYQSVMAAQAAAQPRHIEDCLAFAANAWRRPLTMDEKQSLRTFYNTLRKEGGLDHVKAIRALIARILVSPAFLYRLEQATPPEQPSAAAVKTVAQQKQAAAALRPLTNWEMATRLSYFLWSSIPDAELRRAAEAGELTTDEGLQRQLKRMLAHPKARRMATEFFGQWLGFYRFDEHRGVDTSRFTEFTDEVKSAMYDEAVSFFEYVLRHDRPVRDLLHADYGFLNEPLAKHYGIQKEIKSKDALVRVEGVRQFNRGGMLRLGAVLTVTSAPLRTSPVKRGDWVLRRVLGTPTPPPPANAGSIPADEKNFGGLSLREKLQAHQRNATCAGCHARIDPLGFPLEGYDAVGRWRNQYSDGKPIEDSSTTVDHQQIDGVEGLIRYLDNQQHLVLNTLAHKLIGYALGRTILASDQPLIDRMIARGNDAPFSTLIADVVLSKQFRNRRAVEQSETPDRKQVAGNLRAAQTNPSKVGAR